MLYQPVLYQPVLYQPVLYQPVLYQPVLYLPVLYQPGLYQPSYPGSYTINYPGRQTDSTSRLCTKDTHCQRMLFSEEDHQLFQGDLHQLPERRMDRWIEQDRVFPPRQ